MQKFSDGFVPCLRFPCLLLHHISCPKPRVTNILLGDVQAKGERVGWRPPALSEKKKQYRCPAWLGRLSPLHALLGKEEACLQQLLHCCEQCLSRPLRECGWDQPHVAQPRTHQNLARGRGGCWEGLAPILAQKRRDDFSSVEFRAKREEGSRVGEGS